MGGEAEGVVDGGLQAGRVGLALPGDVERRAVVGTGAHEGQAQRDVDALVQARYLTGIRPWSWYCATTTSKRPWRACMNRIAGPGPLASMLAPRASMAGGMMRASSSPNSPPSPACGFRPATAARAATPSARAPWCASRMADICASKSARSMAWRSEQWMVTSTVAMTSLASIMATRPRRRGRPGSRYAGIGARRRRTAPRLWMGAVTMPATRPSRARSMAWQMA